MASVTTSSDSSKPEYQMVSHVIDIKDKLEDQETSEHNIYRVPSTLWNLNKKKEAYTPQLISIGPLHYGQKHLKSMQRHKRRYFGYFWVRVKGEVAMKGYKEYLSREEKAIRNCYAEKFSHINNEQFIDMMLLDAVFIMELLLRTNQENKSEYKDDSILKQTWLNKTIKRDLLLLENQIPFSILEELYEYVPNSTDEKHPRFIELAASYFECFYSYKSKPSSRYICLCKTLGEKPSCSGRKSAMKFIKVVEASQTKSEEGMPHDVVLMTATKLKAAGVSFEKVVHRPLLDIKFKKVSFLSWFLCLCCIPKFTYFKTRLQIPQLKVDDTTELVLRNLIAFEQCHYSDEPYICNYVSFIDSLIHTKDDVELLVEKQVIIHELGSDKEVATLVNGLCKHVVTDQTCYQRIINYLNEHYQNPWNHTMAALRLVYFRDAWRIAVLMFTIFNFCRGLLDPKTPAY